MTRFESMLPQPVIQLRAGNAQPPRRPRFVPVNFTHGSLNCLALDDVQVCAVYRHWRHGRREAKVLRTNQPVLADDDGALERVVQFSGIFGPPLPTPPVFVPPPPLPTGRTA